MSFTFQIKGELQTFPSPCVMGIINATPDSFFSESRTSAIDDVLKKAEQMLSEGADILDIGGQSTRPGAERISVEEEKDRVLPAIKAISDAFPKSIIGVDTFYSEVAREAVSNGAAIVNDVSAGSIDPNMFETVSDLKVPYILMHMQGEPGTMQDSPQYDRVVVDIIQHLAAKLLELKKRGVHDVAIDPGFGFGKTNTHNYKLLNELSRFKILDAPILAGVSRKGMIWKTLGVKPEEALNGTTAAHMIALMHGADILRVHDVKEAKETVQIYNTLIASAEE